MPVIQWVWFPLLPLPIFVGFVCLFGCTEQIKVSPPPWASKGYIHMATSLFRFINSLWYFHKMSGSRCFDQFISRQQKYWTWDLSTFPTLASFTNNFLLSQIRRKWLMRAGRPRYFSLPGWSVTPHLSNVKPHQSNNWMQVSAGTISH